MTARTQGQLRLSWRPGRRDREPSATETTPRQSPRGPEDEFEREFGDQLDHEPSEPGDQQETQLDHASAHPDATIRITVRAKGRTIVAAIADGSSIPVQRV